MNIVLKYLEKANPLRILDAMPDIKGLLAEREYRKMEKLGGKLGIPIPGMHCRRQIFLDGKQTFDSGFNRSHTVDRNYYNFVFCMANAKNLSDATFGTALLSLKDTDGAINFDIDDVIQYSFGDDLDSRSVNKGILATSGTDELGIVIGTNSGAEDFEGFALGTRIVNGSDGGEMDYSQSELHAITNATLTLKNTLIRDFNNNSPGSITVEEAGIYVGITRGTGSVFPCMITRDLTGGDVVASAAQYRYTYESTLVYPS